MATIQPWIVRSKPQPYLRLFCFPYAGGGASIFRFWSATLPTEVEVCSRPTSWPRKQVERTTIYLPLTPRPGTGSSPAPIHGHTICVFRLQHGRAYWF